MSNTTNHQELSQRIEQLVREHIEAIHRTAREALDRAFAPGMRVPVLGARRKDAAGRKRRGSAEVSTLVERLYQMVCVKPGESIPVLAAEMSASARELYRPMALLKRAGRVRSVGQRQNTRYFPRANVTSS